MIKCLTPQEIEAFYDDDLPSATQRDMADHLAVCAACRMALDELQQFERQLCEAHNAIEIRDSWLTLTQSILQAADRTANIELAQPLSAVQRFTSVLSRYPLWGVAAAAVILLLAFAGRQFIHLRSVVPVSSENLLSHRASTNSTLNNMPENYTLANPAETNHGSIKTDELPVLPNVRGYGDFLVAKHPAADDDFEFYFVLPIRK